MDVLGGQPPARGSTRGLRQPPGDRGTVRAAGSPQLLPWGPCAVASILDERLRGELSLSGSSLAKGISKHLFERVPFASRLLAGSDEKARCFFPPWLASCPKTNCPPLGCTL